MKRHVKVMKKAAATRSSHKTHAPKRCSCCGRAPCACDENCSCGCKTARK